MQLVVAQRQRRRGLDQAAVARRDDQDAARERLVGASFLRAEQSLAVPAGFGEAVAELAHPRQQRRHLLEDDERRRARERVADVRVRVDVFRAEVPEPREAVAQEERRAQRQAAAERLADAEDVGDLGARPERADASEPGVDRVDDKERARRVAPRAQRRQESVRRHPRAGAALHGLHDHAGGPRGELARILAERETVHGPREPVAPRLLELRKVGRREREQSGAVVGAVERDDAVPARREPRGAERDLDRVLPRHTELRRPGQRVAQAHGHLGVGEVAERVDDRLRPPRLEDARIAMAERGDAEAAGQVEQLAAVGERDATAFRPRPDHRVIRNRRPTVERAIVPAIAGFSWSRRSEYWYQCSPNGTYTRSVCPSRTSSLARSSRTPSSIWNS